MILRTIVLIACMFCLSPIVQAQDSLAREKTYALVVQFHSFCCGVPDAAPLNKAIKSFRKKYKTKKIHADKIGPMGREGEYYLAFTLKELTKKQRQLLIKKITNTVPVMKEKGQASIEKQMTIKRDELPSQVSFEKLSW